MLRPEKSASGKLWMEPDSLSHAAGIVTAVIGSMTYTCTLSALVANTKYNLYITPGSLTMQFSVNENSIGPVGFTSWILIGSLYANGGPPTLGATAATTIAFGSFVNIIGVPKTDWIGDNLIMGGTVSPPLKATARVNDDARWYRHGDTCFRYYAYHHNNNAGATIGSGIYLWPAPINLGGLDQTKVTIGADANGRTSLGACATTTGANGLGWVKFHDANNLRLTSTNNNATVNAPVDLSSTFFSFASSSYAVGFLVQFPVVAFSNAQIKDL